MRNGRYQRRRALTSLLVFAPLYALLSGCSPPLVSADLQTTVYRIADGDTVSISPGVGGEDRVRLVGVDTPETGSGQGPPQPYAEESTGFTRRSLQDRDVTLQFDVEREDDYGGALAYLYLLGGTMFNETLLREGYAQIATFPPNTRYLDRFEEAQEEAHEAGRGIWSLPEGESCRLRDRGNGIGGC